MNEEVATAVAVAEATRADYLRSHQSRSATTIAAMILFDKLIDDLKAGHEHPVTFLTRNELKDELLDHPKWGARRAEKKLGDIADLVKTQLKRIKNKQIFVDGRVFIVSLHGPIQADRRATSTQDGLALEIEFHLDRRVTPSDPEWPLLIGRCVCCGNRSKFDPNKRYCAEPECPSGRFVWQTDRDLLVTIIPERDADYAALKDETENALVQFVGDPLVSDVASPAGHLPYEQDHLAAMGLTLGKPLVYPCTRLENWSDFEKVWVLDLAPYRITSTLKDPKSWAVVNCAIDAGVSLLALYTAGNAGLSMAHLLYEAARLCDTRFRLFALVEDSLPDSIQTALRSWDCTVVEAEETPRYLLEPKTMWKRIERHLEEERSHHDLRWHVTDGWDGVGVTMYRLMFIEVLRRLNPDFVVVPVGTGSLFTGAHLALTDVYGRDYRPQLIGAVPLGGNVTRNFIVDRPASRSSPAVASKLVGKYTPLSPVLDYVMRSHHGKFLEVSKEMQEAAARALFEGSRRDQLPFACEPSALAAPAALKGDGDCIGLWEVLQAPNDGLPFRSEASVLVVNSGLGIMTGADVEFLKSMF